VFWRALGRLIMVPLGFVLATIMAVFILLSLGMERVTQTIHRRDVDVDVDAWFSMFDLAQETIVLFSTFTVIPAILLVIVGEVARIRSSVYYIVGGGAVLAAWPLLNRFGAIGQDPTKLADLWTVFATAGFAGGFIYWLVAGRRA
jgi:hypothetical protein